MSSDLVRVALSPSPGYCFKSAALSSVVSKLASPSRPQSPVVASPIPNPSTSTPTIPGTLFIPNGSKVFVNIAWDNNVPPPPEASDDTINRAMRRGEAETKDLSFRDALREDGKEEEDWTIPVVVSEPRQDLDKAGNPSIVFDCVYSTSLKSRALRDAEFRTFLNELSLQRVESQTTASSIPSSTSPNGFILSRELKTPNIASKGKLAKRTVLVPRRLYSSADVKTAKGKNLVEEVQVVLPTQVKAKEESQTKTKKGILKTTASTSAATKKIVEIPESVQKPGPKNPTHKWTEESNARCLVMDVPDLTLAIHVSSTLDVEPRRIIFTAPPLYALDLDSSNPSGKEFDVDGARAEWRVKEGRLMVYV